MPISGLKKKEDFLPNEGFIVGSGLLMIFLPLNSEWNGVGLSDDFCLFIRNGWVCVRRRKIKAIFIVFMLSIGNLAVQ